MKAFVEICTHTSEHEASNKKEKYEHNRNIGTCRNMQEFAGICKKMQEYIKTHLRMYRNCLVYAYYTGIYRSRKEYEELCRTCRNL